MSAIDIANAALMEIGLPPTAHNNSEGRLSVTGHVANRRLHQRAIYLARLAVDGPDFVVRCPSCAVSGERRRTTPCTPVRDALRGITCGGTS